MALSTRKQQQPQHYQYVEPQLAAGQPAASQPAPGRPIAAQGPRRKWPWIAGGFAFLSIWLLPSLVVHSPLLGWVINKASADLSGTVKVRSASLGWFSPISAEGIEVRDAKGQPILQANSLHGDKSLLSLLGNFSALGKMKLDKPKLTVELSANSSNVEEAIAKYLAPSDKPSNRVGVELEIVDGTVELIDQVNNRTWNIEKLQLALAIPAAADKSIELKTQAVISDLRQQSNLGLEMQIQPDMSGRCKLNTDALPMAMFDAILKRFAPNGSIAGRLATKLDAQWGASGRTDIQGQLSTSGFDLGLPALGTDRLAFERLEVNCRAAGQNNVYVIEPSTLDCDLGKLSVSGSLDFSGARTSLTDALLTQNYQVQGTVDLARLAAMLPGTLRIREETEVTAGMASVNLTSRKAAQGMVWHADVNAGELQARTQSGDFSWDRPIALVLDVHQSQQGLVIDGLKCESDFLAIEATGEPDNLSATAEFNLKTLADQLGKFSNLGNAQLGGEGWARFTWKQAEDSRFETKTELQVRSFQWSLVGQAPWTEDNVMAILQAKGKGQWNNLAAARLDEATLTGRSASEQIDAVLTQPVAALGTAKWPIHIETTGKLQDWVTRLSSMTPMPSLGTGVIPQPTYRAAGNYQIVADCSASAEGIQIREARVAVSSLQFASESLTINEPRMEGTLAGSWDQAKRRLSMDSIQLTSNFATLDARNLTLAMPANGNTELTGSVSYKADLARVVDWVATANPAEPRTWKAGGALSGTLAFQSALSDTNITLDAEIANLTVSTATGAPAVEPRVRIMAKGAYSSKNSEVRLEKASITSQAIVADMAGQMGWSEPTSTVKVNGNLGCDFAAICGLLRPYLGTQIDVVGRSSAPFAFEGPTDFTTGRGNAGVQWQQANIYGFPLTGAAAKLTLSDGIVRMEPVTLPVSQGHVNLAPVFEMKTRSVFLPPGKLADHIQITRPMCDSALMYIAPVLADVADARGAFSIELEGARIPVSEPATSDVAGRLIIHDVEVGVSPLIEAMVSLFGRVTPGKLRREAVVPFRMVDGRVYHQNLELIFPEVTIRTQGSVGIDQSISLVAEMPIPQKWVDAMGRTALADSMRGQTISVPVGGTLKKPVLDQSVFEKFTKKAVRGAAENLIENEVSKGLNRLLGPRE